MKTTKSQKNITDRKIPKKWFSTVTLTPGPGPQQDQCAKERQQTEAPPPIDPWAHRSIGMRCSTCMRYVPKAGGAPVGRCRRHAPTMNGYPVVFEMDWCGDHRLDENKIR